MTCKQCKKCDRIGQHMHDYIYTIFSCVLYIVLYFLGCNLCNIGYSSMVINLSTLTTNVYSLMFAVYLFGDKVRSTVSVYSAQPDVTINVIFCCSTLIVPCDFCHVTLQRIITIFLRQNHPSPSQYAHARM